MVYRFGTVGPEREARAREATLNSARFHGSFPKLGARALVAWPAVRRLAFPT
jgi:hypothetical protein